MRLLRFLPVLIGLLGLAGSVAGIAAKAPPPGLTAEQDHQRIMGLLGIQSLRPGASGDRKAANSANYDEAKANPFPKLPDPLIFNNGKPVLTSADWQKRRAELFELFDREIYGRVPKHAPAVTWETESLQPDVVAGIPVMTRRLVGKVDNRKASWIKIEIALRVTTPISARGKVPVMLAFGFPENFRFPGRGPPGPEASAWMGQLLERGWGYAVVVPMTIQADNGAGLTDGIIGLANRGQPRKVDDWGALRAWAWGASRALDYLESDEAVDASRVGIEGLSRYGKAALVTMAYDPRFAIGFIGSSGEGGAKLHRRDFGEKVENLAGTGEYHWMAGNFLKYAGPLGWNDMPVDQHELIALVAPRPLFIGAGSYEQDGWVDPRGSFIAATAADPVYRLLGEIGLGTNAYPAINQAIIEGDIGFRQHDGGHTSAPNWATFIDFADRRLGIAGNSATASP